MLTMRAVTWPGKGKISVDTVPDPELADPTDAIIEVSSTAICVSDLHLYEVLTPFTEPGDIIGHEPMGTVVEAGKSASVPPGDRVVVPFTISCGQCWMCTRGLTSVRKNPGAHIRFGRRAFRLLKNLWFGPGRTSRVPARSPR